MPVEKSRCAWARSPLMIAYHDREWGRPVRDDRVLFEFLTLEGAQAGLSWETVLNKRERYREVFKHFDIAKVAKFRESDVERLMLDAGIIRNRAKILAAVCNAKAVLEVQREFGSFAAYLSSYVGDKPIVGRPGAIGDVPATSPQGDSLSKDLRARGFKFVGPTIAYAFMQATGMVDDHLATCFRAKKAR
jgi:DNA-3-methyladenine glycosylase I